MTGVQTCALPIFLRSTHTGSRKVYTKAYVPKIAMVIIPLLRRVPTKTKFANIAQMAITDNNAQKRYCRTSFLSHFIVII